MNEKYSLNPRANRLDEQRRMRHADQDQDHIRRDEGAVLARTEPPRQQHVDEEIG